MSKHNTTYMNSIKFGNKIYKYESHWRTSRSHKAFDYNDKQLPFPKPDNTPWQDQYVFLDKLIETEKYLTKKRKYKKSPPKKCILTRAHTNISTGYYELNNIRWNDGLKHYIKQHNVKPSDEFINIIYTHQLGPKILSIKKSKTLRGMKVRKNNKIYLKLDKNQILIMDALMEHGGKNLYVSDDDKSFYRFSEHAGLLDFDNDGLEKIIIDGRVNRIDDDDNEIFLPNDMADLDDFEYIFHTHPPSHGPGGRAKYGILYESPSIGDVLHFKDHYNYGKIQGSIVVTPEGLYIIRKHKLNNKKIRSDENKLYTQYLKEKRKTQDNALDKYSSHTIKNKFYSVIAQDKTHINHLNKVANKFGIHIDYYPRINVNGKWIIDTIYLPVYVVENIK